jgi:DNA polymerase-3 subunit chi
MPEILFYHLQSQRLEEALPLLVEKTLEKGWRALIRAGSEERLKAIDEALWTNREESFIPHGREADGEPEAQPVLLSTADTRVNQPDVVFLVDRADLPATYDMERLVLMFDGADDEALDGARAAWKSLKALGHSATYWQQEGGRWVKKG